MKPPRLVLAILILITSSAASAAPPMAAKDEIGRRIDQALETAAAEGGAGVLRVRRGAQIVLERAFGTSCEGGEPMTVDHLFDIGSITKVMTAAAVLAAVEAKQLTLETSVGEIFPRAPADQRSITVGELLMHRSGLPESLGLDETLVKRPFFLEQLFATAIEPLSEGEKRYSNAGFSLLAAILEERTGQSYEEDVRKRVLAPPGVGIAYATPPERAHRLACGSLRGLPWGSTADYFGAMGPSWYLLGNGGLIASAAELDRWFAALWEGQILGPESTATLRSALSHQDKQGRSIVLASGSNLIFSSLYESWPDDDLVFILLTSNADWPKERLVPLIRPLLAEMVSSGGGEGSLLAPSTAGFFVALSSPSC
jgi:CubicO group peptidase (beta-lactamase class C family)